MTEEPEGALSRNLGGRGRGCRIAGVGSGYEITGVLWMWVVGGKEEWWEGSERGTLKRIWSRGTNVCLSGGS